MPILKGVWMAQWMSLASETNLTPLARIPGIQIPTEVEEFNL